MLLLLRLSEIIVCTLCLQDLVKAATDWWSRSYWCPNERLLAAGAKVRMYDLNLCHCACLRELHGQSMSRGNSAKK